MIQILLAAFSIVMGMIGLLTMLVLILTTMAQVMRKNGKNKIIPRTS